MKNWFVSPAVVGVALIFQILWRSVPHSIIDLFNYLSVAIVFLSLRHGEKAGALSGSIFGLIQDTLTLRVFGLAGLTKTCLGFLVGLASRKLNLQLLSQQLLFLFLACSLEILLWSGLAYLIFSVYPPVWSGGFWVQPLTTSLIASLLFHLTNK